MALPKDTAEAIANGGVDLSTDKDGGLVKTVLVAGDESAGSPSEGDTVFVHYVGTLAENGDKFDSSRDRGDHFSFTLGRGQVIKGWDLGVASMKKGEKSILTCRADYAYGETGSGEKIPAGATLNFEVELFRWTGEDISPDRDGTITRHVIVAGEKYANPSEWAPITLHAVGKFNGQVFYDRELEYVLGEGAEQELPDGVDKALKRFNRGEKSRIFLSGTRHTYGKQTPFGLPENAQPLEWELFLKNFQKVKASWELTATEKIQVGKEAKERGTEFFKNAKYRLAQASYKRVEDLLQYEASLDGEEKKVKDDLLVAVYNNSAMVFAKLGELADAIKYCDKVLVIEPTNVKALFRKAQYLQQQNEEDEAIKLYDQVLAIEPDNKAAQQNKAECRALRAKHTQQMKDRFKKMFGAAPKSSATNGEAHPAEEGTSGETKDN